MCLNVSTLTGYTAPANSSFQSQHVPVPRSPANSTDLELGMDRLQLSQDPVCSRIVETFTNIIKSTVLANNVFSWYFIEVLFIWNIYLRLFVFYSVMLNYFYELI